MADITKLKSVFDAYGVGVRAGVITPQTADEEYLRDFMGLPVMSEQVKADWAESDGVRRPITLSVDEDGTALSGEQSENNEDQNA
jgi:hypothetical protein